MAVGGAPVRQEIRRQLPATPTGLVMTPRPDLDDTGVKFFSWTQPAPAPGQPVPDAFVLVLNLASAPDARSEGTFEVAGTETTMWADFGFDQPVVFRLYAISNQAGASDPLIAAG
jgi:hypothetical protein